ncbi:MAG: creatininase family protein [Candidatus Latescibacterota bacterium]|nr:creatininase family protein [Candidatus Latescibacterota bacterium]
MDYRNVLFGELTRKELAEAIESGTVQGAIVPTGATEQHQDHLAMIHDTASVTEIARRAADRFYPKVLVAPTVPISVSEHHMNRGGALTTRPEIFLEYVHDICDSLKRLGVPRIMVLNGHGGNKRDNLEPKCPEHFARLDAMGVVYITYWLTCPEAFYDAHLELENSAGHAGEFETSFAMLAFPERIRTDQINYDNALKATLPKGGLILDVVLDGVSGALEEMLS